MAKRILSECERHDLQNKKAVCVCEDKVTKLMSAAKECLEVYGASLHHGGAITRLAAIVEKMEAME